MFFGKLPVEETRNTLIAHSIRLKDRTLKKGHIISDADILDLKNAGLTSIVVARLEPGDIDENTAASSLAAAIAGDQLQPDQPFTGRCNIRSTTPGLLSINAAGIDHINRVHESLTVATLPYLSVVDTEEIAATVKIIPFAVEPALLDSCLAAARDQSPIMQVLPFTAKRAGLIQTRLAGTRESVLDKTTAVLAQRLAALQGTINRESRCDHDEAPLRNAIETLLATDIDMLLITGASAIVDRRDIVPAAITAAGGEVIHFGMPTDPGNLLLLAHHETRPIIGLPGCARSPKRNGLDLVLERLAAGIPVNSDDIMALGHGGLLQEIRSRPQPREQD